MHFYFHSYLKLKYEFSPHIIIILYIQSTSNFPFQLFILPPVQFLLYNYCIYIYNARIRYTKTIKWRPFVPPRDTHTHTNRSIVRLFTFIFQIYIFLHGTTTTFSNNIENSLLLHTPCSSYHNPRKIYIHFFLFPVVVAFNATEMCMFVKKKIFSCLAWLKE